ncbi:hypothetical protein MBLNU457_g1060t1 [Dothideomycetes sp. NU457]
MIRTPLRRLARPSKRTNTRSTSSQTPSTKPTSPTPSTLPHLKPNLDASPSQLQGPSPSTLPGKQTILTRIQARTPKPLQRYLTPLYSAPVSHISSFLILHEITAVVPLFFFAGVFHYTGLLPENVREWKWVDESVGKAERYARRKGWVSDEAEAVEREGGTRTEGEGEQVVKEISGAGLRIVLELATAWAVTKALLPVRIVGCVWATPWFARSVVLPGGKVMRRVFGRSSAL